MAWRGRAGALAVGLLAGGAIAWHVLRMPAPAPAAQGWIEEIRDVARLEALDVTLHKKIVFAPDPVALTGSWHDVVAWAADALNPKEGKVIVFAVAHLGVDLQRFGAEDFAAQGREAYVVLPPLQVQVELLPADTEVIGSNLNSEQTMALLQKARVAFAQDVMSNAPLQERARRATQNAVSALLLTAGFRKVHFVETLPPASGA